MHPKTTIMRRQFRPRTHQTENLKSSIYRMATVRMIRAIQTMMNQTMRLQTKSLRGARATNLSSLLSWSFSWRRLSSRAILNHRFMHRP